MSHQRLSRALVGAFVLVVGLGACRFSGFADAPSQAVTAKAKTWLVAHQQADGGFELSGFPGFETPDAVLAIGEQAQTTYAWNAAAARAAVLATVRNGKNPLHVLDDLADGTLSAGQAAKLVVLVTGPLGLSATSFDPDADGAKNLVATIDAGAQPNGTYGAFNATLYAAIAKKALHTSPLTTTIAAIRAAQQSDGGWNYTGTSTPQSSPDIDSTALAIEALVGADVAPGDPDLLQGLAYLAAQQRSTGAWQAFGADDPNSTSVAALAITAAGFDPNAKCWRNTVAPGLAGNPYGSPIRVAARAQQVPSGGEAGRIASPSDASGINTFATTQAMQALERNWVPVAVQPPRSC